MRTSSSVLLLAALLVILAPEKVRAGAAEDTQVPPEENYCAMCHGEKDVWEEETLKFFIPKEDLEQDIHWKKGIQCHHCHGGDPATSDFNEAHALENGFRVVKSPTDVSKLCARCHSDAEYMKRYQADAETGQEAKYWESAHGQHLRRTEDAEGATCVSCHGKHGMRALDDPESLVSPSRLMEACGKCHHDQLVGLRMGVHAKVGDRDERGAGTPMGCDKCHGEDAHEILPVDDVRSPVFLDHQVRVCGGCHEKYFDEYVNSVHGHGLYSSGLLVTAACSDCHGAHEICYAADKRSTLHAGNVAKTCGKCHRFIEEWLQQSVHARDDEAVAALSNLLSLARQPEKPEEKVAEPILKVARQTASRLQRLPGTSEFTGEVEALAKDLEQASGAESLPDRALAERLERVLERLQRPSCTACHQGHDLLNPKSVSFRLQLPHRCGNCHPRLSSLYQMSLHGQLTELGYGPAAKCSDCHGAHDILPPSNLGSGLSPAHRLATCKRCHPYTYAASNFLDFDPHADPYDPARNPLLHWVYVGLMTLLFSVFGFFGLHSFLWFVRSLVDVLKRGRPRALGPGAVGYVRFGSFHRVAHTILLASFLGLALTGLPLKYDQYDWAKTLARLLGGFGSTSIWHRFFGAVNLGCLAVYLVRMSHGFLVGRRNGARVRSLVFGPDSPVPNLRDLKDFLRMVRWFVGLGPKPKFERWAYWEKFDFWGAAADIVIIGSTGLVLWFPNLFCSVLPGSALNIAKVIHSTQALLATGFVFAIHFFSTHLRPEKFPMDMSILTGVVGEEELREERPEYLQRIREARVRQVHRAGVQDDRPDYIERILEEGKLEQLHATMPSRGGLWLIRLGGCLALATGLSLLAGILLANLAG
jgi:cytochrome b subunit of formate dehydrogenase